MKEIRTRIAPSPTGMMHLGTARTAIYCWAVARHFGGKFLLRIEDTDQVRSTKEAVQVILDGMKWLNLDYDEGPVYQMDRLARYQEVVDEMLADGRAYYCYATPEELDALREQQRAAGLKPRYDGRWRPENCVGRPIPEGVKPVIRFRNPDEGSVTWKSSTKCSRTAAPTIATPLPKNSTLCASSSVPPVSSLAMTAAGVRKTVWDAPFPKA